MRLQFRDELGPIIGKGKLGSSGIRTARSRTRHVHENDWQTSLAKSSTQLGGSADDLADRLYGRNADNSFLQVNDDQCGNVVEFRERHDLPFGWLTALVSPQNSRSTLCS